MITASLRLRMRFALLAALTSACATSEPSSTSVAIAREPQPIAAPTAASIPLPQSAREALEFALEQLDAHGMSRGEIVLERIEIDRESRRDSIDECINVHLDARFMGSDAVQATKRVETLLDDLRRADGVRTSRCDKTLELDGGIRAQGLLVQLAPKRAATLARVPAAVETSQGSTIRAAAGVAGVGAVDVAFSKPVIELRGAVDEVSTVTAPNDQLGTPLPTLRRFASEIEGGSSNLRVTRIRLVRSKTSADAWIWRFEVLNRRVD